MWRGACQAAIARVIVSQHRRVRAPVVSVKSSSLSRALVQQSCDRAYPRSRLSERIGENREKRGQMWGKRLQPRSRD